MTIRNGFWNDGFSLDILPYITLEKDSNGWGLYMGWLFWEIVINK